MLVVVVESAARTVPYWLVVIIVRMTVVSSTILASRCPIVFVSSLMLVKVFHYSFLTSHFSFLIFNMYILLWERYFDVVGIQRVVDGAQHVADHVGFLDGVSPDKHIEVDAGVTQLANY